MSRSTVAKSRQDKAGKVASAPTPAVTHEIVPGKFNDQDWSHMLERDDGDDFISDIVEEIASSAMDQIYHNYIDIQLVPYTVLQAKDAILQIIEWQFLSCDEGEGNIENDPGWMQDEEPCPAVTDCWAQGSVPRTMLPTPTPEPIEEERPEDLLAEDETQAMQDIVAQEEECEEPSPMPPLETEPTVIVEQNASAPIVETIVPQSETTDLTDHTGQTSGKSRKKRGYKPHTGSLRSAGLGRMTESLEDTEMKIRMEEYSSEMTAMYGGSPDPASMQMPTSCQSILKLQAGRPPGNRDVIYDDHGNVVSVTKLDPEKLPSHSVKTRFDVLDSGDKGKQGNNGVKLGFSVVDPKVEAAQARLEAMRTGKYIKTSKGAPGSLAPRPPDSARGSSVTGRSGRSSMRGAGGGGHAGTRGLQDGITPLPPPLIEAMEVSPGVVVREGDRVKKGPRQRARQSELIAAATSRGLRTITINTADPKITVSQLLQHQQPIVRPLTETPPIPPITQQSQHGQVC